MEKTSVDPEDTEAKIPNGGGVITRKEVLKKFAEFLKYNGGEGEAGSAPYDDEYAEGPSDYMRTQASTREDAHQDDGGSAEAERQPSQ